MSGGSAQVFGAILVSPSGAQRIPNSYLLVPPFTLVSGSTQDGSFEARYEVPQFAEAGVWSISLAIKDRVRNTRTYDAGALTALGFPGQFTVVRPSLVSDGTLGSTGGTVADAVFQNRASVNVPPGVLSGPTDVAIDVFSSPLAVPIPSGYTAGSMFVNINLMPAPAFPLPPPGLTIVLPLSSPMPANDRIELFRIDPSTGAFVRALDGSGQPVVGTVDPGGLSATFVGVAALSVVAGLVPAVVQVAIGVRPGSEVNPIQPKSGGVVPVAVLSSPTFDAPAVVERQSLTFGRSGDEASLAFCTAGGEDVNADGHLDLMCLFYAGETALQRGDTQGVLKGRTIENLKILAADAVLVLR